MISKKGLCPFLVNAMHEFDQDFLGLQEIMVKMYNDSFFKKLDFSKSFAWHWVPARGKSGGILNFDIFDIYNFKTGDFSTMTNVHDKKMNSDLCLVFVYGPAQEE